MRFLVGNSNAREEVEAASNEEAAAAFLRMHPAELRNALEVRPATDEEISGGDCAEVMLASEESVGDEKAAAFWRERIAQRTRNPEESLAGARRERPVPCQVCHRPTWNHSARCDLHPEIPQEK